ncbi:MAG: protoporphyrinogen/coproporphyrinogen oxidase [Pseudonocardiaceae bacterium]
MSPDLDVAVVGGGIAGLSVAYALQLAGRSVQVFEAADGVGGRMRTLRHDGYLIDTGAELVPMVGNPATWKLIRELGLGAAEVPRITTSVAVWRGGRAHHNVGRPLGFVTGAGLSWRGRRDLLRFIAWAGRRRHAFDPDCPERTPLGDVTVAQLGDRFGRELHDYLFQPIVGGFFSWHTDRSAAAPFVSQLLVSGSSAGWRTYRDGMDTLARRLAERVEVTTGFRVREVVSAPGSGRIVSDSASLSARSVVLCVPAPLARDLHANAPPDEHRYLEACTYAPVLRVSCALDRPLAPPAARPVYTLILPAVEDPVVSVIMVDHLKHPGRAPSGRGLVTLLTCPLTTRELIDAPDEEVVRRLTTQAERYLPGLRQATVANFVHRYRHGLPEATPAAVGLRSEFLRRPLRAVDYAGDWVMLRPASEGAVRSADLAAWRVMAHPDHAARNATGAFHGRT